MSILLTAAMAGAIIQGDVRERECNPTCRTQILAQMAPPSNLQGAAMHYFVAIYVERDGQIDPSAGAFFNGSSWQVGVRPAAAASGPGRPVQVRADVEGGLCAVARANGINERNFVVLAGIGQDKLGDSSRVDEALREARGTEHEQQLLQLRQEIERTATPDVRLMMAFQDMRSNNNFTTIGRIRCE